MDGMRIALLMLLASAAVTAGPPNTTKPSKQDPAASQAPSHREKQDAWLKMMVGRFTVASSTQAATTNPDMGLMDCKAVGKGPAFQCYFVWSETTGPTQSFRPEAMTFGKDPDRFGMRGMVSETRSSRFEMRGPLKDGVVYLERQCAKAEPCSLASWQIASSTSGNQIEIVIDGGFKLALQRVNQQ